MRPRCCRSLRPPPAYSARFLPEPASDFNRVNTGLPPPSAFVAGAMRGAVMHAAERDREFIARLAAQRAWLHVAQMVGIGWLAATDEARLLHDKAKVLAAAVASRGSNRQYALVDALCLILVGVFARRNRPRLFNLRHRILIARGCSRVGRRQLRQPAFKSLFHELGVGCREAVLGHKRLAGPRGGEIRRRNVSHLDEQFVPQLRRLSGIEDDTGLAFRA